MIVDLPAAYVGLKKASARASRRDSASLPGVLSVLAEGRTRVALEREWRLTMALALRELPSGTCLVARDATGREWYIGPAGQAAAQMLRKAA